VGRKINLSFAGAAILQALAQDYRYGFDIMDVTGLPSGTVYPALRRLEQAGLVRSKWEDEDTARKEQRPARKYYELTSVGRETLSKAVGRYRGLEGTIRKASRAVKPSRS
jgi:PadR family transcriptional regulator, regulatory protein PadR